MLFRHAMNTTTGFSTLMPHNRTARITAPAQAIAPFAWLAFIAPYRRTQAVAGHSG